MYIDISRPVAYESVDSKPGPMCHNTAHISVLLINACKSAYSVICDTIILSLHKKVSNMTIGLSVLA